MAKFTETVERKILPAVNKFANQKYLKAISSAFMSSIAPMMIGGIALLLIEPPVDYTTLSPGLLHTIMKGWTNFGAALLFPLLTIFNMTIGMVSVFIAGAIGYYLSRHYNMKGVLPIVISLMTFFVFAGIDAQGELSFAHFGSTGLFTAIIVSVLTIEAFRFLVNRKVGTIEIKAEGVPPAIAQSFTGLVPASIIILAAALLSWGIVVWTGGTLPELVAIIMSPLISGVDSIWAVILLSILVMVLWWFGIHDSAITGPLETFWSVMVIANLEAYGAGTPTTELPHIFAGGFWWIFMTIGGSGATLALCILLLTSKSKHLKTVGKLSIVPGIFNINEPIIFGVPIMLNPIMFVPFVGAMTVNGAITYILMDLQIIARPFLSTNWNMPAPIAAFLSTLDWKAAVLVLVLIVIDGIIYYPFFKIVERQKIAEEEAVSDKNSTVEVKAETL